MISFAWIVVLASLVATKADDLNLADALDGLGDDLDKVTEAPKAPEPPKNPEMDLGDALDALDKITEAPKVPEPPKNPEPAAPGGDLDLNDAVGGPDPVPDKPVVVPPKEGGTGGGGSFGDSDLIDAAGDDYKPDKGKGGGRAVDPAHDGMPGDQPAEASSGPLAGILSAVGVAIMGAASSYFAYQKKKLCFKVQGGVDPESGKHHQGTESEPQVLSDLLRSS